MTRSHVKRDKLIQDPWDVATGVVMLGLSLLLLFYLIPHQISEPPIVQNPMMSPRWLPQIVGWLVLVLGVLLVVQGVIVSVNEEEDGRRFGRGPWQRFVLMIVALVVYVTLFEVLGAVISGTLATLLLFVAHPVRTWWVYSLAFIFPIGVTLLFTNVMNVPLPMMPF